MNKVKRTIIWILCLIIVCGVILRLAANGLILNSGLESKEWKGFVEKIKKENPSIKSIALGDIKPTLFVTCKLNKEIDLIEAEKVFEEIRSYILSEEELRYLQDKYIKIHGNGFMHVYIRFDSSNNSDFYDYEFSSRQSTSGVATFDSFKKWEVNVKGQFLKEISP